MALLEIKWNPSQKDLRQFAWLWLAFFALIGGLAFWRGAHSTAAWIWALTLPVGLIGAAHPSFVRPIYTTWMYLAFPIGWTVSHGLILLIYYCVVTPIGLMLRASGYDPMMRKLNPAATTYWVRRSPPADVKRYFRQY